MQPELTIGVVTADCVPLLFHFPDIGGVAAVHAGWKGTIGKIAVRTLEVAQRRGADPVNARVWFGPSICVKCYEVSQDLAARFVEAGYGKAVVFPPGKKPLIDLEEVNILQLTRRGVPEENIIRSNYCTFTTVTPEGTPLFPSYRRTDGTPERLLSCITLKRQ